MGDALKEQVLIIKTAWGGKTLGGDFRPPTSAKKSGAVGHYYQQMIQVRRPPPHRSGFGGLGVLIIP